MQKANRQEVESNRQHSGSRIVAVRVKNDACRRFGLWATAAAFFNPNGRWLLARGGILADWMIFYTIRGPGFTFPTENGFPDVPGNGKLPVFRFFSGFSDRKTIWNSNFGFRHFPTGFQCFPSGFRCFPTEKCCCWSEIVKSVRKN